MAGTEVFVADFNGDDYDDLLLGAQNNDGSVGGRRDAGAAYVILGGEAFEQNDIIDLANPSDNVFTFYGASPQDRFGLWVDGGDFDGDGYADLLIGANQADGINNERINAGEAWIVFGGTDLAALYEPQTDMSMPPSSAARIIGADYDDLFGSTTLGADVDQDGFDDALVSAALWRESAGIGGLELGGGDGIDNLRYNSGETFVIYGHSRLRGSVIDLAALLVEGVPNSEAISVIYGADANDLLGEELAVGDFNGDEVSEIALGSLIANGADNTAFEAGEAWIISAHPPFRGKAFDVLSLELGRGFVIYPDQADSMGGDILRFADLNDDGYDELLYGAPTYDYEDEESLREDTGLLAIFWGGKHISRMFDQQLILPSSLPTNLDVNYLVGADSDDETVYGLAVYDFDQDGHLDIAPNAMLGDGADNRLQNAGDAYIVSGLIFQQRHFCNRFPSACETFPRVHRCDFLCTLAHHPAGLKPQAASTRRATWACAASLSRAPVALRVARLGWCAKAWCVSRTLTYAQRIIGHTDAWCNGCVSSKGRAVNPAQRRCALTASYR
ncbi:hypothetical protein FBR02_20760 [Anaerolineae bacterium CFX9]|nr:hypothetical protein [Anaerolineae bacterium CFX9]